MANESNQLALPDVGHLLPFASETSWSNLLASMITTDPTPLWQLLGIEASNEPPTIVREVPVGNAGRIDLIIKTGGKVLAVIEIKVLSGLGPRQLDRYQDAVPDAEHYLVVHPKRLTVDVSSTPDWDATSWEAVLGGYAVSANAWVATTARAWRAHLDAHLPKVDGTTVWNELSSGDGFVLQMRTRFSWLHSRVVPPTGVRSRLGQSSKGVSSTFGLSAPAAVERYTAVAEVEERLPVQSYPKWAGTGSELIGPSLWVGLRMDRIDSSEEFDWMYLLQVWNEVLADARSDWATNSARKSGHDRDGWKAMVQAGGPKHLGVGFGAGQVKINRMCMFGARAQLRADISLEEVAAEMDVLSDVVLAMAEVQPPA